MSPLFSLSFPSPVLKLYHGPVRTPHFTWHQGLLTVIQSLSRAPLFATPWTTAHQSSLSFTISQGLSKLDIIESVIPSNHLILCRPHLLLPSIFPSIRIFSMESALRIRWPKHWSFSFSISTCNEYSGLISFRIDRFDLLLSKGLSNTTVPRHQFGAQPSLWSSFLKASSHLQKRFQPSQNEGQGVPDPWGFCSRSPQAE